MCSNLVLLPDFELTMNIRYYPAKIFAGYSHIGSPDIAIQQLGDPPVIF